MLFRSTTIGLPFEKLGQDLKYQGFFNNDLITSIYQVEEIVFDINKVKGKLLEHIKEQDSYIKLKLNSRVLRMEDNNKDYVSVTLDTYDKIQAKKIFNVTYAGINQLLKASSLDTIALKYEVAELVLVEVPERFKDTGITLMDGPFFSCIPFPSRNCYSLSHVRYTPHSFWHESELNTNPYKALEDIKSNFLFMKKDAQRYMPILSKLKYIESLFEIKTIVSRNEVDDGRPIVLKKHSDSIYSILGTKLDNIYDLEERIEKII